MSWFWTLWLVGLLLIFAVGETYALRRGKLTLSRFVWQASEGPQGWPPLLVVYGIVLGGLAAFLVALVPRRPRRPGRVKCR